MKKWKEMDQFEKLKTIRLTKANQQKLLDENNGFIAQTNYNSIRGSFHRSYKILDGKLIIHDTSNNTSTEKFFEKTWTATDEEVHRFLLKYLWKLSIDETT